MLTIEDMQQELVCNINIKHRSLSHLVLDIKFHADAHFCHNHLFSQVFISQVSMYLCLLLLLLLETLYEAN